MLAADMAPKSRTTKPRSGKAAAPPEDVPLSFAEIGREAAREAQRKALLRALKAHDWNLAHTADALSMGDASAVIRALKSLAPEEYDAAREDGRIRSGRPSNI